MTDMLSGQFHISWQNTYTKSWYDDAPGEGPRVSRESLGYGNSSRSDTGGEGFLDGTDDERGQGEGAAVL